MNDIIASTFGLVGTLLLLGGYLPQIKKLLKTKNADGQAKSFWVILTLGITCLFVNLVYGYTKSGSLTDPMSMVNMFAQAGNAVLAGWVWFLVSKYQK